MQGISPVQSDKNLGGPEVASINGSLFTIYLLIYFSKFKGNQLFNLKKNLFQCVKAWQIRFVESFQRPLQIQCTNELIVTISSISTRKFPVTATGTYQCLAFCHQLPKTFTVHYSFAVLCLYLVCCCSRVPISMIGVAVHLPVQQNTINQCPATSFLQRVLI